MIHRLIELVLSLLGWYQRPDSLKSLEVVEVEGKVRLSWKLSPGGSRQFPVVSVRVETRLHSDDPDNQLSWVKLADFPATVEGAPEGFDGAAVIENVLPGAWDYRAYQVDSHGQVSKNPLAITVEMPGDAPNDLASFVGSAS